MAESKENTISLEDNHDDQDEKNSEDEEEEVVVRTPKELYEALLKASRDGDESCAREVFGEGGLEPSYVLEDMERHRNKGTWIPKWDPLTTAVVSGHTGLVNLLLERGYGDLWKPLSDSKMGSTTPLHWASCKGHLYILCDLLDFFGTDDVNSRDADGNCCLHLAASCGFGKSIEILLTAGIECANESHVGIRKRLDMMIQECALAGGYDSLVRFIPSCYNHSNPFFEY